MRYLILLTSLLALCVIVLGAYTRLTDAGLGCPDWPGCYGHLVVPSGPNDVLQSSIKFQQPLEASKAWTEMIHRYVAGTLGLCIFLVATIGFVKKVRGRKFPTIPLLLTGLVVFQALLGMWTVTLLLKPVIVLLHLLGGLTILSLLWWYFLTEKNSSSTPIKVNFQPWAFLGLILLFIQIALGGWTSTNYAALVCPDFPYCQGKLVPHMDFGTFFADKSQLALVTIHMMHRFGALVIGGFLACFSAFLIIRSGTKKLEHLGFVMLGLLAIQITFGVINVMKFLPMPIAVGHNLIAALLVITMVSINFHTSKKRVNND